MIQNKHISNTLIFLSIFLMIISKWHLAFHTEDFKETYFNLSSITNYAITLMVLLVLVINFYKIVLNSTLAFFVFGNIFFIFLNIIFADPSYPKLFHWLIYSTIIPIFSILVYLSFKDRLIKVFKFLFTTHKYLTFLTILLILYFAGPLGSNILPGAFFDKEGYNNIFHADTLSNGVISFNWISKSYIRIFIRRIGSYLCKLYSRNIICNC